eukprot:TRINITY_DN3219_c0_g1_i4.p1 TRINITY_DN3219_c0_g1~~TRINITY_DN3219_c0_g1_i4.p1  ORF type:complete len:496 (+),score=96.75 TRINITY_DN3219_c0_g1_i4:270-1757(+)
MDGVLVAHSLLHRRRYDRCIELCTALLAANPLDQAVWLLKARALFAKQYVDDTELEPEGVADLLLEPGAQLAQLPRPGTSLQRLRTAAAGSAAAGPPGSARPSSAARRPASGSVLGFARPATAVRPATSLDAAFQQQQAGARPPLTSSGRSVRLGTASLLSEPGGPFVNVQKLNLHKYSTRPALGKMLASYLLVVEDNAVKALELATLASQEQPNDWWWRLMLAKCHYRLALYRDAESQLRASLQLQEMLETALWLGKVYERLDQPRAALDAYLRALEAPSASSGSGGGFAAEPALIIAVARLYDALHEPAKALTCYKRALQQDNSSIEALACLAAGQLHAEQPELALRYYRRLLQAGLQSCELWNNLGLCCFSAQHYDLTLACFERALVAAAADQQAAAVWYNIGQLGTHIGNLALAYQALKICLSLDPLHAEANNNLAVLEMRKGNVELARPLFRTATKLSPHLADPLFNEGQQIAIFFFPLQTLDAGKRCRA